MAIRKNTKFIDPRYFMDEKMERVDEGLGAAVTKAKRALGFDKRGKELEGYLKTYRVPEFLTALTRYISKPEDRTEIKGKMPRSFEEWKMDYPGGSRYQIPELRTVTRDATHPDMMEEIAVALGFEDETANIMNLIAQERKDLLNELWTQALLKNGYPKNWISSLHAHLMP
jgi:hypothetical protein